MGPSLPISCISGWGLRFESELPRAQVKNFISQPSLRTDLVTDQCCPVSSRQTLLEGLLIDPFCCLFPYLLFFLAWM